LLCHKRACIYLNIYQPDVVLMLVSVLDYALPPGVNDQVTIQSYIPESLSDQYNDTNIAFYHVSNHGSGNSGKETLNKMKKNFITWYLDSVAGPAGKIQCQRDLIIGNISDNNLLNKFRKAYSVSKDGSIQPPKRNLLSMIKEKYSHNRD